MYQCRPTPTLVNLDRLDVNFWKIKKQTYFEHLTGKQFTETDYLISEELPLEVLFWRYDVIRTLWYIIIMITVHIVEEQMLKIMREWSII